MSTVFYSFSGPKELMSIFLCNLVYSSPAYHLHLGHTHTNAKATKSRRVRAPAVASRSIIFRSVVLHAHTQHTLTHGDDGRRGGEASASEEGRTLAHGRRVARHRVCL